MIPPTQPPPPPTRTGSADGLPAANLQVLYLVVRPWDGRPNSVPAVFGGFLLPKDAEFEAFCRKDQGANVVVTTLKAPVAPPPPTLGGESERDARIRRYCHMAGDKAAADIDALLTEADALKRDNARMVEALGRIGSMDAFTISRPVDKVRDAELIARIDFARAVVASLKVREDG